MRDKSHLDDMRAAIRGDFQRLEERRGEQELMRPVEERERETPPAEPQRELDLEQEPEPVAELQEEPHDEIAPSDERAEPAPEDEPPRRTWLDRLLGR